MNPDRLERAACLITGMVVVAALSGGCASIAKLPDCSSVGIGKDETNFYYDPAYGKVYCPMLYPGGRCVDGGLKCVLEPPARP